MLFRSVSREVPSSALKGGKHPVRLHATPKSSPTRRVPSRGTFDSVAFGFSGFPFLCKNESIGLGDL